MFLGQCVTGGIILLPKILHKKALFLVELTDIHLNHFICLFFSLEIRLKTFKNDFKSAFHTDLPKASFFPDPEDSEEDKSLSL